MFPQGESRTLSPNCYASFGLGGLWLSPAHVDVAPYNDHCSQSVDSFDLV